MSTPVRHSAHAGRATAAPNGSWRWLAAAVAIVVTAWLLAAVLWAPSEFGAGLLHSTGNALVLTVPITLLLLIAARGRPAGSVLGVTLAVAWLTVFATGLPRWQDEPWSMNWIGKGVDLLWILVVIGMLWGWARSAMGLRWRIDRRLPTIGVLVVFAVIMLGLAALAAATSPDSLERASGEQWLWDSTYPNLTEELIWRGLMLAVLDQALGTPWTVWGAPVGWGLVITAVAFGVGHGATFDDSGFTVHLGYIAWTAGCGALFAWIRALSGSLWPAFVAHCLPELAVAAGALLVDEEHAHPGG